MTADRTPTFFLLGAPKAGTTALYALLNQHPDVFLPAVKEPHHYAYRDHPLTFGGPADERIMRHMVIRDAQRYRALYRGRSETALGDASAMQLYVPGTEARISDELPNARFVVVLRDPVQRAFSSWLHLVRDDREWLSFEAALDAEPERIAADWIPLWHYVAVGRYAEQLTRWFEHTSPERFHILLHDDLRSDPVAALRDVFRFLDVDPNVEVDTTLERNVSGVPKSRALQRMLSRPHPVKDAAKRLLPPAVKDRLVTWLRRRNVGDKPALDAATASRLRARFDDDVAKLEELLGRDLTGWRR